MAHSPREMHIFTHSQNVTYNCREIHESPDVNPWTAWENVFLAWAIWWMLTTLNKAGWQESKPFVETLNLFHHPQNSLLTSRLIDSNLHSASSLKYPQDSEAHDVQNLITIFPPIWFFCSYYLIKISSPHHLSKLHSSIVSLTVLTFFS